MTSEAKDIKQRRSNQIKLLILWLVPFGLMAIAGICYYLVMTGQLEIGSKNKGDLIRPAVQVKQVLSAADDPALADVWDGKWTMALRVIGHCDQQCRDALMLSRQLHIRLDKEANRVQRVMLVDQAIADPVLLSHLETEHSLLKVISLEALRGSDALNRFDQLLQETVAGTKTPHEESAPELAFFLVDQSGYAMMTYHQGHDGNDILQDLKQQSSTRNSFNADSDLISI